MPNDSVSPERVLQLLGETPKRIAEIAAGLTAADLRQAPGAGQWSMNDVLAHLRCCADVWGDGLRTILEKERPTIRAVSPRGWIKRTNYLDLEFLQSLDEFERQRADLLVLLEPLDSSAWVRTATVKTSGKATTWTLLSYAERLARHEHHHLAQFARVAVVVR